MKNYFVPFLQLLLAGTISGQVPVMSSYPSASAVLFLDFDGQTVSGTSWNTSGPIYCAASGLDNAQITTVFNRVAEDYRPFNLNVTTDSTKYIAAPVDKRMRVILTPTYQWYGSAGGVAFVNSFIWGDDTPCFVFTGLLSYNVKNIAEAAAHEAGHTLGLFHQSAYNSSCVKTSEYNAGQGSGEIGWAPIMGVGYYQNFTLWNLGPNPFGCTNMQNDLTVITTQNGFGYRSDDHNNTFGSATNATLTNNQFTINGVIEQSTDQDMIRFTLPASGRVQLNAVPYNVGTGNAGSDLDMQVTLYNSAQTQISVYNPGALLSSVVDSTLNAGTYYLKVEGKGNMYAPNYASLGSYALEATFTAGIPLPLRQLTLQGQLNGDRHQFSWIVDADEQVVSQVLEVSTDGRHFAPVSQTFTNDRNFSYKPYASGLLQYRLNVVFDNDRQYYSNIVSLRNSSATPKPRIINTLTESNSINILSTGMYDYLVYDYSGKILGRGVLTNGINTITLNGLTSGMYLVRFSKDGETWTEKLVRQ